MKSARLTYHRDFPWAPISGWVGVRRRGYIQRRTADGQRRPNNHWLSRLPAKAKSWKFREAICRHLQELPEAGKFREFYASNPPRLSFPGIYASEASARPDA